MNFLVSRGSSALLLGAALLLGGCLPSAQSQLDEEKEPHFMSGKGRVNAMDYKGAVESFEKALEVNPHSASAHFELGCLFDQKEADPAAAIYHYDHYLKLRSNAENSEIVKTRILACKQELARTVSLGPVTQTLQREFEQLTEENKRLKQEVEKLRTAQLQAITNAGPGATTVLRMVAPGATNSGGAYVGPGSTSPATGRLAAAGSNTTRTTHTVKQSETLTTIARKYGVKVDSILAANPGVDPRRLKVGQTLAIPSR